MPVTIQADATMTAGGAARMPRGNMVNFPSIDQAERRQIFFWDDSQVVEFVN